jgi:hypothetical protein
MKAKDRKNKHIPKICLKMKNRSQTVGGLQIDYNKDANIESVETRMA